MSAAAAGQLSGQPLALFWQWRRRRNLAFGGYGVAYRGWRRISKEERKLASGVKMAGKWPVNNINVNGGIEENVNTANEMAASESYSA